jgi:hypothetical protein
MSDFLGDSGLLILGFLGVPGLEEKWGWVMSGGVRESAGLSLNESFM